MKSTGESYDWQGMVIITILMIIGILIIYFTWGGMEINVENFYIYIQRSLIKLLFSLLFIGVGLYCWKMYFTNVIIKPKKETLYLKNIDNNIYSFIDSKGKKYMHTVVDNREFNVGKYYTVMKTKNNVKEILELSDIAFPICKEKTSYWLNWYSPIGNFENMLLLPIIYMILISGLLSFIASEGVSKIYGLLFMIVPGFIIIYDIVYKIKRKAIIEKIETQPNAEYQSKEINKLSTNEELTDMQDKGMNGLYLLRLVFQIIGSLIFTGVCSLAFISSVDNTSRIFVSPFLICGIAVLISAIISFAKIHNEVKTPIAEQNSDKYINKAIKYDCLSNTFSKVLIIIFLIFWFGFLTFWCYLTIKQKAYSMTVFSLPFWIVGITTAYKNFKK